MSKATRERQPRHHGGRRVKHSVRVTGDQEARLVKLAAAQGVTVARLLVEATLAEDGWTITQRRALITEWFGARRQLSGLATNVNQLAHWANAEGQFPREAATATLPRIAQAIERLEAAVEGLRRP